MKAKNSPILILLSVCVIIQLLFFPAVSVSQDQEESARVVDETKRAAIVGTVNSHLEKYYIDSEVAAKMTELLKRKLKDGSYDKHSELRPFLRELTNDLLSVSNDLHIGVWPIEMALSAEDPTSEEQRELDERARYMNYGVKTVKILPGNIGYFEFTEFMAGKKAVEAAEAAITLISRSDAIVFDLRRNGGGEGYQLDTILGHFFDEQIHRMNFFSKIDGSTRQTWTKPSMHGPSLPDIPVYVLTSKRTASAAEAFTSAIKSQKRGIIIGERTRGAANPVEEFNFPELSICMAVSAFKVSDPVTGTSWEGKGIEPDISVPAEKALHVACIEAIKKISGNKVTEDVDTYRVWALERYKAELDPVNLNEDQLSEVLGEYEKSRSIKLVRGKLVLYGPVLAPITLIPLGDDSFAMAEQTGKLEFVRGKSGTRTGIRIRYADGYTLTCEKK